MSDDTDHPSLDILPRPERALTRFSVVWVVPLLALIVSLAVAWRTYEDRGTLVEVVFADAAGVEAGKTVLKYREVEVGKVESVGFNEDLSQVVVGIRIDKAIAPYVDADSKFWLVHPEITTSGISRLDTVLSGVFIEGLWDNEIKAPATRFVALKEAPLARTAGSGTWVTLYSEDGGSLAEGAPVIYRGIKVGQLRNLRLNKGSAGVEVDAFIKAPYDDRLTSASVFWDTSGFSVSLGAEGLKLNVRSVASLIQGGVEFTTLVSGGKPVEAAHQFRLFTDEASARNSVFSNALAATAKLSLLLDGSIRNLAVGTPVKFRGLPVGEVTDLLIRSTPTPAGELVYQQEVDFALNGEKMGLPDASTEDEVLAFLQAQVKDGLRARVISAGLLGGSLEIELVYVPEAAPEKLNLDVTTIPVMPSVKPKIADFSSATGDILNRVQKLPIEDIMQSAIRLLDSANTFIAKDETQKAPQELTGLLSDLRGFIGSEDVQAVPKALRGSLTDAQSILSDLRKGDIAGQVSAAVDSVSSAAQSVTDATTGLPAMVDAVSVMAAKVNALPLDDLIKSTTKTVDAIGGFLKADGMTSLPVSLGSALNAFASTLNDLQNGGAVANLNKALASSQQAAQAVADATDRLPDLMNKADRVMGNMNDLIAGYGPGSAVGRMAQDVLREVQRMAASVGSLAKMIERNPQSFLTGR
ncbi:MAG: intermembrane transport protein PqiB [Cypionkella sp.]